MWVITRYESATLFSLRPSFATASGGKTLLAPTPFAVKMALLDVAFRVFGADRAETLWKEIAPLRIAIRPCPQIVVTNLFQRVLKPNRPGYDTQKPDAGFFQRTIGYREYAHLVGPWAIGLGWEEGLKGDWLGTLMLNITYFGKRGGFVQATDAPAFADRLPDGYVELTRSPAEFSLDGTMQAMDDCAPDVVFKKINIYDETKLKAGRDRLTRNIVLPYRVTRASRSFTLYDRIEREGSASA